MGIKAVNEKFLAGETSPSAARLWQVPGARAAFYNAREIGSNLQPQSISGNCHSCLCIACNLRVTAAVCTIPIPCHSHNPTQKQRHHDHSWTKPPHGNKAHIARERQIVSIHGVRGKTRGCTGAMARHSGLGFQNNGKTLMHAYFLWHTAEMLFVHECLLANPGRIISRNTADAPHEQGAPYSTMTGSLHMIDH